MSDQKTLGQVAFEARFAGTLDGGYGWRDYDQNQCQAWERAAQAVVDAVRKQLYNDVAKAVSTDKANAIKEQGAAEERERLAKLHDTAGEHMSTLWRHDQIARRLRAGGKP